MSETAVDDAVDDAVDENWFARDTRKVARDLVGATLEFGALAARIVEVEAYRDDAASHFVTRPRTAAMMGTTFGRIYVYRIYGVHRCLNFTTERDGPGAVLLRALVPLRGIEAMRRNRGGAPAARVAGIDRVAWGPANLFVALGLDDSILGRRVTEVFRITPAAGRVAVAAGPRVGISRAVDLPWRFRDAAALRR